MSAYTVTTADLEYADISPPATTSTLSSPEPWFVQWATGREPGDAGPVVNEWTAFNYLTVFNCVSLIASKIASLPLLTYRRGKNGENLLATDRSEYRLLDVEFNPRMAALTAREAGIAHLLTWGNCYAQIVKNKAETRILELVPLGPDMVDPYINDQKELVYDVYDRETGRQIATLPSDEMIHVPALSFDGLVGYSPIRVAKTAIRAGIAQDREAEQFVSRGIRPPGAVKFPKGHKFRDQAHAIQYRDSFRRIHSGDNGSLRVIILEDGAEWQELGVDPESAQLLESRKYSRSEICGMYRVPPFLVGGIETSTSWGTGIGEQKQAFVDYCLMDWMGRYEAELKRKLARDDPAIFYRHQTDELLRGDLVKRTEARSTQHQRGIITDNEWRKDEFLNPVEGGDVRHFPLQEGRIDLEGNELALPAAAEGSSSSTVSTEIDTDTDTELDTETETETKLPTSDATAAPATDVQSTALNGAQITSLLLVTDKVASGDYTPAAGESILQASFPMMNRDLIGTMIKELTKVAKTKPTGGASDDQTGQDNQAPVQPGPQDGDDDGEGDEDNVGDRASARVADKLRKAIVAGAGRCLRKEAEQAKRAASRPGEFVRWIDSFYAKHSLMIAENTGHVVEAWSAIFGTNADYSVRHVERSKAELLAAAEVSASELPSSVERLSLRWSEERLADIAAAFTVPVEKKGRAHGT